MELNEILPSISVKGTENRKNEILKFLNKNNIKYKIQKIAEQSPVYKSQCSIEELNEMDDEKYYSYCKEEFLEYQTKYYYNIIVDIGNFESFDKKIILTAHYDVVTGSTGANDNGSSISILLKLITEYQGIPIRIIFFDGEEMGGIGSKNYIKEYINIESIEQYYIINLDVCGCGDQVVIENKIKNIFYEQIHKLSIENNIVEINNLPFNDAKIFNRQNINNICIVALPQEDIDISKGKEIIDPLTGIKRHFGYYIWKYQHNGQYDNIFYINYNIMNKIYLFLIEKLLPTFMH